MAFNFGKLASNVLNSLDNVAKETLEEPTESASSIRFNKKSAAASKSSEKISTDQTLSVKDEFSETGPHPSKEVELLNAECLELEKQCESLKEEVKRAWDAYKSSQERAAARESELQDEVILLEKEKAAETQQLTSQLMKSKEEGDVANRRFELLLQENKEIVKKWEDVEQRALQWQSLETSLMQELEEARACSSSNVITLRDNLRAAEITIENLRQDHATVFKQSHQRLEQLQAANLELGNSCAEAQRTIEKLRSGGERAERDDLNSREIAELRIQVGSLSNSLEVSAERLQEQFRGSQAREREIRANQMVWEDEKKRLSELAARYAASVEEMKAKLENVQVNVGGIMVARRSGGVTVHDQLSGGNSCVADFEEQVKNLSQQLLKKQAAVQDLLAERSAIKVRVSDLELRCLHAEEQLEALLYPDVEGKLGQDETYSSLESGTSSRSLSNITETASSSSVYSREGSGRRLLQRKRGQRLADQHARSDISSDLEKTYGMKPSPVVARAVDTIDTWTQLTGRYLKIYPLLRLGFVFYLIFLHLWAFVVLAFHTHSLEHNANAPSRHPQ